MKQISSSNIKKDETLSLNFTDERKEVKKILDYLSSGESPIDKIARDLKMSIAVTNEVVSLLELEGIIEKNGNNIYRTYL